MNGIRCPHCKQISQLSALKCQQCEFPFSNLSSTAYVSVPVEETYEARTLGFNASPVLIPQDNETGRKTFFWYRVYCAALVGLYFLMTVFGIVLAINSPATDEYSGQETMIMGMVYAVLGAIFLIIFAVFLFLPRKPYNWIVGIVSIALGMTSCCFLPFLIPLLIYWIKPETKAYFGRN